MDFNIESRWFGCDVVPTEFTEFTEFGCVLLICEYQCHLWENILRWTVLRVPRVLWAFFSPTAFTLSFTSHGFHSEFYLPQISRIYTLSLQKKAIRLNNQGKTMIAKDSFVPLL